MDRLPIVGLWLVGTAVSILAITVWAQTSFDSSDITGYTVFPLLGLLAFSIMWTHYIWAAMRRYFALDPNKAKLYTNITRVVVLFLIIFHPGILIFQLYQDGFGLPPGSYYSVYSAPYMKFAIMLGLISLAIFLSYELKKFFDEKKWWKYIEYANSLAMVAIFYHALRLGREVQVDWYKAVWIFYGLSLLVSVSYIYWYDFKYERSVQ